MAATYNVFGARRLPFFEAVMFSIFVGGLFGILIPLWVLSPMVPSQVVWTNFESYSGWEIGVACLVSQAFSGGAMIGTDGK